MESRTDSTFLKKNAMHAWRKAHGQNKSRADVAGITIEEVVGEDEAAEEGTVAVHMQDAVAVEVVEVKVLVTETGAGN